MFFSVHFSRSRLAGLALILLGSALARPSYGIFACDGTVVAADHPLFSSSLFQLPPRASRYLLWLVGRSASSQRFLGVSSYIVAQHRTIHAQAVAELGSIASYAGGGEMLIRNETDKWGGGEVVIANDGCGMLHGKGERGFLQGIDISATSLQSLALRAPWLFPGLVEGDPRLQPSTESKRHLYEPLNRFDEWIRHDIAAALRTIKDGLSEWFEGSLDKLSEAEIRDMIYGVKNPYTSIPMVDVLPSLIALLRNDRIDHERLDEYELLIRKWFFDKQLIGRAHMKDLWVLNSLVYDLYNLKEGVVPPLAHVELVALP